MITVACVLKSGGIYDGEWVGKLRSGVARHLSLPHRFVCLSDADVPCERIPLRHPWKGWWSKINLFAEFTGPTLYFDLDTVVVGSLDAIVEYPHRFTMTHEFYRPGRLCSTAMAWNGDYSFIFERFAADPAYFVRRHDVQRADGGIGDQAFIEACLGGRHVDTFRDLFGERSIASYKAHKCQQEPPKDAAVVAFHGRPKQNEIRGGWVAQSWK